MNIRFGLCCLVVGSEKSNFKTLQLKRTLSDTDMVSKIHSVWNHNQSELIKVLSYCQRNGIKHYRISSDLFPLADHPNISDIWKDYLNNDVNWIRSKSAINTFINNGNRLSTHPSQFCIITSSNEVTNLNGIKNLEYHAQFFDKLDIPRSYQFPINIHLSNGKLEFESAINAYKSMEKLSDSVLKRLVFETEDKNFWTWQKIKQAFPKTPITLDFHHRLINNEGESEESAYSECVSSWGDIKPLFHHSEGREHRLDRSHSDYIQTIPNCCSDIDLEIEAKQKNLAILRLLSQIGR